MLDNYVDLRQPFAERTKQLRYAHDFDEQPDEFDADATELRGLLRDLEAIQASARAPADAFRQLADLSDRASAHADPALHGVFRALASAAWHGGDADLACNAQAMCLEYDPTPQTMPGQRG